MTVTTIAAITNGVTAIINGESNIKSIVPKIKAYIIQTQNNIAVTSNQQNNKTHV